MHFLYYFRELKLLHKKGLRKPHQPTGNSYKSRKQELPFRLVITKNELGEGLIYSQPTYSVILCVWVFVRTTGKKFVPRLGKPQIVIVCERTVVVDVVLLSRIALPRQQRQGRVAKV